jgi:hypothetical protein
MIPNSGSRFPEKIMLKQKAGARWLFEEKPSRSAVDPEKARKAENRR